MTEVTQHTTRILLVRRPTGAPVPEDFRLDEAPISALQPGEALVRTIWLSLEPSDAPDGCTKIVTQENVYQLATRSSLALRAKSGRRGFARRSKGVSTASSTEGP